MFRNETGCTGPFVFSLFWKWEGCWDVVLLNHQGKTLAHKQFFASPEIEGSYECAHDQAVDWLTRQISD